MAIVTTADSLGPYSWRLERRRPPSAKAATTTTIKNGVSKNAISPQTMGLRPHARAQSAIATGSTIARRR